MVNFLLMRIGQLAFQMGLGKVGSLEAFERGRFSPKEQLIRFTMELSGIILQMIVERRNYGES